MSLAYVIDGYNIIHHTGFSTSKSNFKDDRLALLELIYSCRLCGSRRNSITVVFDGYSDEASLKENNFAIKVVFSFDITADEKIKRIVEESINTKTIVVVSDDRQVSSSAKHLGAKSLGVEEFLGILEKKRNSSKKNNKLKSVEPKKNLSYTQAKNINDELKDLWLKKD
jgi:predicted RNA-binding protein with PIN domain